MQQQKRQKPGMMNGMQLTTMSPQLLAGTAPMGQPFLPFNFGGGTNMQTGGGLQMGQPPATRATPSTDAASSGMGSPIENSPMIQAFLQMMAMRGMGPQQPRRF